MYRVGLCQFASKLLNVEDNLIHMRQLLETQSADLVVLPELATSGYVFSCIQEVKSVAEPAETGPTASLFRELAAERNTSYVVGFVEKDGDALYNASMLVNPDGKVYVYRKTHLFYEEKKWFSPGNSGFNVFAAKGGVKVGMMICFDWLFPESARTLALKGAQILAHSANLVLPWCQKAMLTRSLENRVFSITSNRFGTERNGEKELFFTGMSQIVDTHGDILHRCGEQEEGLFVVGIHPEDADNKMITELNDAFTDRRPELYIT